MIYYSIIDGKFLVGIIDLETVREAYTLIIPILFTAPLKLNLTQIMMWKSFRGPLLLVLNPPAANINTAI